MSHKEWQRMKVICMIQKLCLLRGSQKRMDSGRFWLERKMKRGGATIALSA